MAERKKGGAFELMQYQDVPRATRFQRSHEEVYKSLEHGTPYQEVNYASLTKLENKTQENEDAVLTPVGVVDSIHCSKCAAITGCITGALLVLLLAAFLVVFCFATFSRYRDVDGLTLVLRQLADINKTLSEKQNSQEQLLQALKRSSESNTKGLEIESARINVSMDTALAANRRIESLSGHTFLTNCSYVISRSQSVRVVSSMTVNVSTYYDVSL